MTVMDVPHVARTDRRSGGPMTRIGRWFGTRAAVLWIAVLTTAAVVVEQIFPHLDNHGFWFLYWLTYGSWVTQPLLAFSNRQDTDHAEASAARDAETLRQLGEALARLEAVDARLETAEQQNTTILAHMATALADRHGVPPPGADND